MALAGFDRFLQHARSLIVRLFFFILTSILMTVALIVGIVHFIWIAAARRINHYLARKHA